MLRKSTNPVRRRASAAVEMAFCAPFILLIVVGSVELSGGLHHQHSIRVAAHQAAIAASKGPGDAEMVRQAASEILTQRDMVDFDIDIDVVPRTVNTAGVEIAPITHFDIPATGAVTAGLDEVPRGTVLQLTITATRPDIPGFGMARNLLEDSVSASCVFVKEL